MNKLPAIRTLIVALVISIGIAGCWHMGSSLNDPEQITAQMERREQIRPGKSTREDVHKLLGEPWLSSEFWHTDVYRVKDKETWAGSGFFLYLPIAPAVLSAKWAGYVLIDYDDTNRVAAIASGKISEGGMLADRLEAFMLIRAGDLTLAASQTYLILFAPSHWLADYLVQRRHAEACTLVLACDVGDGCPNRMAIDDSTTFNSGFELVYCADKTACPTGQRITEIPGPPGERVQMIMVPLLYPVDLPAGSHRVMISSSAAKGRSETSFECAPGEVLYARVHSELIGGSVWRKGQIQATLHIQGEMPSGWAEYNIGLLRDGRWLVVP